VSLSDGKLTLLEPDQTGQLSITNAWVAHAHEPWCVAWNYWDTNVIYSGTNVPNFIGINVQQPPTSYFQEAMTCGSKDGM
jgi:diphthamide biosynthesis protein 7